MGRTFDLSFFPFIMDVSLAVTNTQRSLIRLLSLLMMSSIVVTVLMTPSLLLMLLSVFFTLVFYLVVIRGVAKKSRAIIGTYGVLMLLLVLLTVFVVCFSVFFFIGTEIAMEDQTAKDGPTMPTPTRRVVPMQELTPSAPSTETVQNDEQPTQAEETFAVVFVVIYGLLALLMFIIKVMTVVLSFKLFKLIGMEREAAQQNFYAQLGASEEGTSVAPPTYVQATQAGEQLIPVWMQSASGEQTLVMIPASSISFD